MTYTPFHIVSAMNSAFGNPQGDPESFAPKDNAILFAHKYDQEAWGTLKNQVEGIRSELIELDTAYDECNLTEFRDALCDIMVFALGAYHKLGIDADEDMDAIVSAVMSRFCKDAEQLFLTEESYKKKGVLYTIEGKFPRVVLKSAEDQQMPEYPKGKFLKSVGYKKTEFKKPTKTDAMVLISGNEALNYLIQQESPKPAVDPVVLAKHRPLSPVVEQMSNERELNALQEKIWADYVKFQLNELQKSLDSLPENKRELLTSGKMEISFAIKSRSATLAAS